MTESAVRRRVIRDLINAALLEMRGDFRLANAALDRAALGRARLAIMRAAS
jgi:hypothetical protein